MRWPNRKIRIAVVLALAIVVAYVAWRTSERKPQPPCESGRWEEKDASGAVTKISRKACR